MNEHLVSKIINLCVVKLSNSGAITCVSRLDLDHFERNLIRPDLIRGSLAREVTAHFNNRNLLVPEQSYILASNRLGYSF